MGGRRGPNKIVQVTEGPITAIGSISDIGSLDITKVHCFVGIKFFADSGGVTPAVPTTGTVTITIRTLNNTPNYEDPPINTINAASPTTLTWAANTMAVRATPAGVDVATHYRMFVTCNET